DLERKLKKLKIDAEVFVGGSFAKRTAIKKDKYDVDIFVRFDKKYNNSELSWLLKKVLEGFNNVVAVHGSRDYYRVLISRDFFFEIVPVRKIKKLEEAENVTDLSFSHVSYIRKKIKSKKILNDIKLAKAFCYANNCYGAESYIHGFSGYGLELLVYYYGGFVKFLKAMIKVKDKEVVDIEKHFKNKKEVLMNLNAAKLSSPVVLVDGTFKQRNALAGLSHETFEKFRKVSSEFLKNPELSYFDLKKIDFKSLERNAIKNKLDFVLVKLETCRQEGDIAGSKLKKFFDHLNFEIGGFFDVKEKGFEYGGAQSARGFFSVKSKKEILVSGPFVEDKKNVSLFKKKHKKTFVKSGKVYSKEKAPENLKDFLKEWKVKNKVKIEGMGICGVLV
ncbi:nucleotidyltransferase domain-containing protein, partial [Nanoarchaeota archaeon]